MSIRDGLPAAQIPVFDAAIAACAQMYADACAERDQVAAASGARAVAEAAWFPGHALGSVEAIQASYEAMQDEARERARAA